MGYILEIQESKAEEMKEHARKMLRHGGKLMECIEELCEESSIGECAYYGNKGGGYGNRYSNQGGGGYGNRMNYREEWEDEVEPFMGQRRGVPGSGRGRYRF